MKKILFIQPALPQYRISFFKKLENKGPYKLTIIASPNDFLNVKSVPCKNLSLIGSFTKLGPFFWQKGLNIKSVIKHDLVVISGNPRVLNHMLLFFLLKISRKKVIWWGQGWTAGSKGFRAKIRRWIMLQADGIAVYTDLEANEINHPNVIGLNNGIDIKTNYTPKAWKESSILRLLFIGRLTEKSKLDLLLKSLRNMKTPYRLNVIGTGVMLTDYKKIASDYRIIHNITWHGEIFDSLKIEAIANSCDLFIYPGNVGLSLIHAFSLSLPAIIHNDWAHHMPEYAAFKDGVNGLSFIKDNSDSLTHVLESVTQKQLQSMSIEARKTVEHTFNTDDMANRFSTLIKNTI